MAANSRYELQLREASRLVAELAGVAAEQYQLVYQSRSGPPTQPWLEPDVLDSIKELHTQGIADIIIVPIGFISDHMEVLYDLDTEAHDLCQQLSINMIRVPTIGTHPRFVSMIRELIIERMTEATDKVCLGNLGPSHDVCLLIVFERHRTRWSSCWCECKSCIRWQTSLNYKVITNDAQQMSIVVLNYFCCQLKRVSHSNLVTRFSPR